MDKGAKAVIKVMLWILLPLLTALAIGWVGWWSWGLFYELRFKPLVEETVKEVIIEEAR